jgi:PhoH-like ATPase
MFDINGVLMSPYLLQENERLNYVIDTSVLAAHGESIHDFADHNVYLPIEVLEELDTLKTRSDSVGASCRYVNRYLDKYLGMGNASEGILLDNGQTIYIVSDSDLSLLPSGMADINDNRIISVAVKLMKDGKNVTVVSKDIALRVKCDALSIPSIDYNHKKFSSEDQLFSGTEIVEVSKDEIDEFYSVGNVELFNCNFYPNQGVILKSGQSSALAIAENETRVRKLYISGEKGFSMEGITPRSKEQTLACEFLLDPNIHLVTMAGFAGSGKTLLAIAAAIKMLHDKTYKKLIISRPVQSTSKDIGFLPGTKEEKMAPWIQPIFDNIDIIYSGKSNSYIELMIDKGIIEVEAMTYIRGRTLPDTIFIIDEAQNITHHEAKALLTRMGDRSKIILTGDLEQIDSPSLNQDNSGLSSVVELFKEFGHSAHITLRKGERSKLATFAAKVM